VTPELIKILTHVYTIYIEIMYTYMTIYYPQVLWRIVFLLGFECISQSRRKQNVCRQLSHSVSV
jgi:hypothetical protein